MMLNCDNAPNNTKYLHPSFDKIKSSIKRKEQYYHMCVFQLGLSWLFMQTFGAKINYYALSSTLLPQSYDWHARAHRI